MPLTAQRKLLLARIHRRYRTVTAPVDLGRLKFSFTRIADPNRVLDEVAAEEDRIEKASGKRLAGDELHLPYWAELWDSAMGIAQYLVHRWEDKGSGFGVQGSGSESSSLNPEPRTLNPSCVLDLGCGMGLTGTVAAALGAQVTFADLEPAALLFARLNSLPWQERVQLRQLNWRTGRLAGQFDLIVGADIVYERAQWQYLEPFWRTHLAPGGTVLLGEPGRPTGDDFPAWAAERGWAVERAAETVPTRKDPIRLLLLTP